MDKIEYRAVIKFLFLEGVEPKEIYERLLKVYKDFSPSVRTVERWVAEFKRGRTSLQDDPREGRPKRASTPEIVAKIQDMVLEDRRLTERDLVEALGISIGSVSHILADILGFRKLCAKWVPHSLTMEQKHLRLRLSQQHLERFRKDKKILWIDLSLWMRLGSTIMILNQNKRLKSGVNPVLRLLNGLGSKNLPKRC